MLKKFFALLFALNLMLSLALGVHAESPMSGTCGDDARWSYSDGTLTISGTGEIYDKWTIDNAVWSGLKDKITRVVVEDGISYIGSYSFGWCRNLTSITLSNTVTDIGSAAFFYCEALESIGLPQGLTSIGDNAFAHSGLKAIEIPANVTFLGANAFANCEQMTDALVRSNPALPSLVIGNSVFESCSSLPEIRVEEGHLSLRSIEGALYIEDYDGALRLNCYPAGREASSFRLAENTVSIEQYAFRGAERLVEVTIPGTVSLVGSGAFQDNEKLNQVSFEGSAPEFGKMDIFSGCTLTIRYPMDDSSWDGRESWELGGSITWVAYNPDNPFTDVPEKEYYYAPVLWAVSKGITNGVSATEFGPEEICTRGQVVTFLWRAVNCPEPTKTSHPFTDLKKGEYYEKAVLWAVEKGITNGYTTTTFNPDGECTRAQVVTFLHRAMGKPEFTAGSCHFTDVEKGEWYTDAVLWALENGITNGDSATTFGVEKPCTRGQVVTFLYRTYN